MERILEPELMEDAEQVRAYAEANFDEPHGDFIQRLRGVVANPSFKGNALDLGCGSGDITRRFAKAFPLAKVDAVDGSKEMITYATKATNSSLKQRIHYIHGRLPDVVLLKASYGVIYSNSLLHHLPDPQALWQTVNQYTNANTVIVVMDLLRPETPTLAQQLVQTYAVNEPEILQQDFYNSLLAAFTLEEIKTQLEEAELPLSAEQISDRHVFISGKID